MERVRQTRRKVALGEPEKRGLAQLLVCLALFLCVFLGRGVFPEQTGQWAETLGAMLRRDTDFQTVFVRLGQAVAEEDSAMEALNTVWVELSGTEPVQLRQPERVRAATTERVLPAFGKAEVPEWEDAVLALTPVNDLGLQKTVAPVEGVLSSAFGLRIHPIDGVERQHNGIDVAAEVGTQVVSFADGVVKYIGESEELGKYICVSHNDQVSTLYAHCSELCATSGDVVQAGQVVAKVGDTGKSTGPHLHFALEKDGTSIDPLPYWEQLS